MKNFNNFIFEGKNIVSKAYKEIIYNIFNNNGFGEYTINLKNDNLPLFDLNILVKNKFKKI
jgi:hypothetical protein